MSASERLERRIARWRSGNSAPPTTADPQAGASPAKSTKAMTTDRVAEVFSSAIRPLKAKQGDTETTRTGFAYHADCLLHRRSTHREPERPERVHTTHLHLTATGLAEQCVPITFGPCKSRDLRLVHDDQHINYVDLCGELVGVHGMEDAVVGPDLYANAATARAARLAAGGAVAAARAVANGDVDNAFCLLRPPGHHCSATRPSGFCFFNNVACAVRAVQAEKDSKVKKVLVVDWDVHHGDGTEAVFYDDPSVLFFSVHQHGAGKGHEVQYPEEFVEQERARRKAWRKRQRESGFVDVNAQPEEDEAAPVAAEEDELAALFDDDDDDAGEVLPQPPEALVDGPVVGPPEIEQVRPLPASSSSSSDDARPQRRRRGEPINYRALDAELRAQEAQANENGNKPPSTDGKPAGEPQPKPVLASAELFFSKYMKTVDERKKAVDFARRERAEFLPKPKEDPEENSAEGEEDAWEGWESTSDDEQSIFTGSSGSSSSLSSEGPKKPEDVAWNALPDFPDRSSSESSWNSKKEVPFYPSTGAARKVGGDANLDRPRPGQWGADDNTDEFNAEAVGTNVNVPWPTHGMGDLEYLYVLETLLLPKAKEFQPDMIIVSSGFDCAQNDLLGSMNVSPSGFFAMTALLKTVCPRLVVVLEGGYNVKSVALSSEAVVRALLGTPLGDDGRQFADAPRAHRNRLLLNQAAETVQMVEQHHEWAKLNASRGE